jgi:integrase
MPRMHSDGLIDAELKAEVDRFATWLTDGDASRRRRRNPKREDTVRLYCERLTGLLHRAGTLEPSAEQVRDAFLDWMRAPTRYGRLPSDSTYRSTFYALKAYCEWRGLALGPDARTVLRDFDVPRNPRNGRTEVDVMHPDDVRLFMARLGQAGDRRNYAICRAFVRSGPRRRVLALAKVRHFDHAQRRIVVDDQLGKGGMAGEIMLDPVTADSIRDYLESRWDRGEQPNAPLFHSYLTNGHLNLDSMTKLVAKLTTRYLGREHRRTPHQLRHTFLTYAANGVEGEPMPLALLAKQAQHSNKTTTLRYIHGSGDLRSAYDRSMGAGPCR